MTVTPSASTLPWATSPYTWTTSRSAASSLRRRPSRRTLRAAVVPEVSGIILVSAVAAIGVLLASFALALPSGAPSADGAEVLIPGVGNRRSQTLRERVNRPFEALADRSSQRRRLNGGVNPREPLMRANQKAPPPRVGSGPGALPHAPAGDSLPPFGFGHPVGASRAVGFP